MAELLADGAGEVGMVGETQVTGQPRQTGPRTRGRGRGPEQARAQEATLQAAHDLVDRLGLSVRDAAELLGLSHQRVQQLLAS